jgi:hypothetical protein
VDIRAFESWRDTSLPVEKGTAVQILSTPAARKAQREEGNKGLSEALKCACQPALIPIRHPEFISGSIYPDKHKVQRINGC